jgi:serine/threonine protein kinase/tetratricopeptide (TPR) repeat protein
MQHPAGKPEDGVPRAVDGSNDRSSTSETHPAKRIGHYRILRKLGEGGMGIVYEAHDERLDRAVAIKTIRATDAEQPARKRLWKEARAAARVNHPNVCQLYEIGEDEQTGSLFLVMELLGGESLDRRLGKGRLPLSEALQMSTTILRALEALHGAGIIHLDLKPSNVFLAPHGIKLLDFGLAQAGRICSPGPAETDMTASVTVPHAIAGTPCYMAPEQVNGGSAGPPTDLFAVGCILFEMLTGNRAFSGTSLIDVLHAVLYDRPPALSGSPALAIVDRVIRRALEKQPGDRYSSAQEMLQALCEAEQLEDTGVTPRPRSITRLIVLPFRILRHHETSDFLAVSLPEAITSSLSGIDSVIVRSTLVASRLAASTELDIRLIGEQAQVDALLTGAILSDGEHIRVTTQLVEAVTGTTLWANTAQLCSREMFTLHDDLVDRIVQSLTLPLTAHEQRLLKHDVPASVSTFEFYLRANQLTVGRDAQNMMLARDLYLRCLEADPRYAPAWARLGRVYRFIAKFVGDEAENLGRAEEAFQKSFSLNPDLAIAHNFYTPLETDLGRALGAMERLLKRAQAHRNDPDLFTGLVQACRYCGLLKASVAADERARRLDPNVTTSVAYTFRYLNDFRAALDHSASVDEYAVALAWAPPGHEEEAIGRLREREKANPPGRLRHGVIVSFRCYLEGERSKSLEAIEECLGLGFHDPEARFALGALQAKLNEPQRALDTLSQALEEGYICYHTLLCHPWLDSVRAHPGFPELASRAGERSSQAQAIFVDNGGDWLLGVAVERMPLAGS